ncbi:unnamed protein product [Rhizoctonia solani]|uniref:PH domain-containing protein n=1 Tax=Rhizoctonia solani TaxID=456999 RepID=A0A8H3HFT8_9AGAM|nr:unnamed protein product [Rhizoctonia solani]
MSRRDLSLPPVPPISASPTRNQGGTTDPPRAPHSHCLPEGPSYFSSFARKGGKLRDSFTNLVQLLGDKAKSKDNTKKRSSVSPSVSPSRTLNALPKGFKLKLSKRASAGSSPSGSPGKAKGPERSSKILPDMNELLKSEPMVSTLLLYQSPARQTHPSILDQKMPLWMPYSVSLYPTTIILQVPNPGLSSSSKFQIPLSELYDAHSIAAKDLPPGSIPPPGATSLPSGFGSDIYVFEAQCYGGRIERFAAPTMAVRTTWVRHLLDVLADQSSESKNWGKPVKVEESTISTLSATPIRSPIGIAAESLTNPGSLAGDTTTTTEPIEPAFDPKLSIEERPPSALMRLSTPTKPLGRVLDSRSGNLPPSNKAEITQPQPTLRPMEMSVQDPSLQLILDRLSALVSAFRESDVAHSTKASGLGQLIASTQDHIIQAVEGSTGVSTAEHIELVGHIEGLRGIVESLVVGPSFGTEERVDLSSVKETVERIDRVISTKLDDLVGDREEDREKMKTIIAGQTDGLKQTIQDLALKLDWASTQNDVLVKLDTLTETVAGVSSTRDLDLITEFVQRIKSHISSLPAPSLDPLITDTSTIMEKLDSISSSMVNSAVPIDLSAIQATLEHIRELSEARQTLDAAPASTAPGLDMSDVVMKLDGITAMCQSIIETRAKAPDLAINSGDPQEEAQQTLLTALKEDAEQRSAQAQQTAELVRYSNELNSWLEKFVTNASKQMDSVGAGLSALRRDLGLDPPPTNGREDAGTLPQGVIQELRIMFEEQIKSAGDIAASLNALLVAFNDEKSRNIQTRENLATEPVLKMIEVQRQEQERLLKQLASDLSSDIRGERIRFVEAMSQATSMNVQLHVEEFKKQLTHEVLALTDEVGRLREERKTIQHQIAQLFMVKSEHEAECRPSDAPQPPPRPLSSTRPNAYAYPRLLCALVSQSRSMVHAHSNRHEGTRSLDLVPTPDIMTKRPNRGQFAKLLAHGVMYAPHVAFAMAAFLIQTVLGEHPAAFTMSYNDSNAYGTDGRRNEFDSTRRNEFGDNTRQGELNDNTRGDFNDNTKAGHDSTARSDDYTSGNVGAVGSGPAGFTDSIRTGGRAGDTYDNNTGNYGSSTTGDNYGSSKPDNYGTTNTHGLSNTGDNYGSTDRTGNNDLDTRTGEYGSSNTDNYGLSNTSGGYSKDTYGSTAGTTGTGYGTSTTDKRETSKGDNITYGSSNTGDNYDSTDRTRGNDLNTRADEHGSSNTSSGYSKDAYGSTTGTTGTGTYGNPNTENFGNTDRNTYGRGTNATGTDDFNTDRGNDHKPTLGEKVKGTMETIHGKVTKNPELIERGQERKAGNLDHH